MFFVHNPDIAVVFHPLHNPKQPRGPFFIAHVSYPVLLRILGVRSSSSFNRKIHENPWQPYIAPPISQGSNSKFAPEKMKDGKDRHLPKKDRYFIQGLSQGSYAPEI